MKRTLTSMLLGLAMMAMTGCNISGLVLSGGDPIRGLASLVSEAGASDGKGLDSAFQPDTGDGGPGSSAPASFCLADTRNCQ